MGLRFWGVALLVIGILVVATGGFAAFAAREMWQASDARCAGSPNEMCGAGESLAAAFLLVLGPLGLLVGLLILLAGGILLAVARRVERGLEAIEERALAALATVLE